MRKLIISLLLILPALASAAITFPVASDSRWTLVDVRTTPPTVVAAHLPWPGPDLNTMPPGFDAANYALLLEVLPTPPAVDARYYQVERLPPTINVQANTITWAWSQNERAPDDKKAAAETEEGTRHGLIAKLPREARDTHIAVAVLYAMAKKGYVPTPKVTAFMDDYLAKGVKLRDNWQRLNDIFNQIEAGQYPDLDSWPWPNPLGE